MMSRRGIRPNAGFGENESFLPVGLQPEGPPDAQMIQKSHGFLSLSQLELTLCLIKACPTRLL
jgi:hypothetical protein